VVVIESKQKGANKPLNDWKKGKINFLKGRFNVSCAKEFIKTGFQQKMCI
jgi:hypothetical protein